MDTPFQSVDAKRRTNRRKWWIRCILLPLLLAAAYRVQSRRDRPTPGLQQVRQERGAEVRIEEEQIEDGGREYPVRDRDDQEEAHSATDWQHDLVSVPYRFAKTRLGLVSSSWKYRGPLLAASVNDEMNGMKRVLGLSGEREREVRDVMESIAVRLRDLQRRNSVATRSPDGGVSVRIGITPVEGTSFFDAAMNTLTDRLGQPTAVVIGDSEYSGIREGMDFTLRIDPPGPNRRIWILNSTDGTMLFSDLFPADAEFPYPHLFPEG